MEKRLRWGVLGFARIARTQVIPAILKDENSEFYAIASRSQEKLDACAKEFSPGHCYKDYDELLDDPEVDAVYIPLPNAFHYEWTIKACRRKKHVLCEKPIAMSETECREMARTAQDNGVLLMEAFMYRYTDRTKKLNEILQSGKLGDLKYIYACWRFLLDRKNTIKEKAELGGGSLWDVGAYPVNFLGMVTDQEAISVSAQAVIVNGVDTLFAGSVKYQDGLTAQISCGFNAFFRTHAEIIGNKGLMIVEDPFSGESGEILVQTSSGTERVRVEKSDRYGLEISNFSAAALGQGTYVLSLDQSIRNIALLERLHKAGQSTF